MVDKRILKLFSAILLIAILTQSASAQEAGYTVVIRVIDPFNEPMKGVEVTLRRGEETFRFLTNSTGYALFTNLEAGRYDVEVRFREVIVSRAEIEVPKELSLELVALLARINISLIDLDGDPVARVRADLRSSTKRFNSTLSSDENGLIAFRYIPYSSLPEIGNYSLGIFKGAILLHRETLNISKPAIKLNLTLPLIDLKLLVTNLEGEPVPRVTINLRAGNFSDKKVSPNGTAYFENIPSSIIEDIGEYRLNITMRTLAGDIPIYFEERMLVSSKELDLIADLGKLIVKVVDEEGLPVRGIEVILSNELAENFTAAKTDLRGFANFTNIPLSRGRISAGRYLIRAFREERVIGEAEIELLKPRQEALIEVSRMMVRLVLRDYHGSPLKNYTIHLTDRLSGEKYRAVTELDGSAELKLFAGDYFIEIFKGDIVVYRESLKISKNLLELKLDSVNFPCEILVEDVFGNPVRSASLRALIGDELIHESALSGEPIKLSLPHPATISIELYSKDGGLIHKEMAKAEKPSEIRIRLRDYVELYGLIPLEDLGFAISMILLVSISSITALLIYKARKPR